MSSFTGEMSASNNTQTRRDFAQSSAGHSVSDSFENAGQECEPEQPVAFSNLTACCAVNTPDLICMCGAQSSTTLPALSRPTARADRPTKSNRRPISPAVKSRQALATVERIFAAVDIDNSGFIDADEIEILASAIHAHTHLPLTLTSYQALLRDIDSTEPFGKIGPAEFREFFDEHHVLPAELGLGRSATNQEMEDVLAEVEHACDEHHRFLISAAEVNSCSSLLHSLILIPVVLTVPVNLRRITPLWKPVCRCLIMSWHVTERGDQLVCAAQSARQGQIR